MSGSLSVVAIKDGNGTLIAGGARFFDVSGTGSGPWVPVNILHDPNSGQLATIKAASTAPVGGDTALVVAVSPNTPSLPVKVQDGTGTGLSSDLRGTKQALAVEILDGSGAQITSFGGSGGTASNVGSTAPTTATAVMGTDGTNARIPKVFDEDTGAGTDYVLGATIRAPASGGSTDIAYNSGPTTAATIRVTEAADSPPVVTLGAKTDAASTATDGTSISMMQVLKQISKTLQAAVAAASTALFTKITDGTNNATVKPASTPPAAGDTALVVGIHPSSINPNGRALAVNSAPVVLARQSYQSVAASTTATLQTTTGAVNDWLDFILVIPASTSPGSVQIKDGGGTAITIFPGGASSVSSLVPFAIPVRAVSAAGAWSVITGASVSVLASGNFF